MDFFDDREKYIKIAKDALDKGDIIPFQEGSCYSDEICSKCANAIEKDLGNFDDLSSDKFLGILFGFLQYLSDEKHLTPTDTEYISQLLLLMVLQIPISLSKNIKAKIIEILMGKDEDNESKSK